MNAWSVGRRFALYGTPSVDPLRSSINPELLPKAYCGAMYSRCGGGYLYVVSEEPVPGGFQVKVRVA
jgi:hypothetical protein